MNPTNRDLGSIELNPTSQQHQINILSASHAQSSQQPSLNLPCRDLLDGRREDFNEIRVLLYKAAITGDLKAAKIILDKHQELVRFSITESYETVLHIAILGKSYRLVKYLVNLMTKEDLELSNGNGETALYLAAIVGDVRIAKILLKKNEDLLHIPSSQGNSPLYIAASFERWDMAMYLYNNSSKMADNFWTCRNQSLALVKCVEVDLYGVAVEMVTAHPELAINTSVLKLLAQRPYAFDTFRPSTINRIKYPFCHPMSRFPGEESDALQLLRIILTEIGKFPKAKPDDIMRGPHDQTKEDEKQTTSEKEMQEAQQLPRTISKVLFLAAKMGNAKFLCEVIRQYPHLVQEVDDNNQSIFHVAVSHRHEGVFKLLYEIGAIRDLIITLEDKNGNNMLHLAGERVKDSTGDALQLKLELLWYKEVKRMLPRHLREKKNKYGLPPHEVFIENHIDLFSVGEKGMKEIATQLMVVAALVATISFAAVFTFPGGYNQDTGIPIFLRKNLSKIFIISDSLSFISSTTSILMVLSILGSNFDEYDFMISLPKQLTICLASVFISIAAIILTFLISIFLLCQRSSNLMPILISAFAAIPYMMFAISKYYRFLQGFKMHKK